MELTLLRNQTSDHGTFGLIEINDEKFYTLELPWRDNMRGISCIPEGSYECFKRHSGKFGSVYELKDVQDRSAILIHYGNYGGDRSKGFRSDIEGCILLGFGIGILSGQKCVLNSRKAVKRFIEVLEGEPFILNIRYNFK